MSRFDNFFKFFDQFLFCFKSTDALNGLTDLAKNKIIDKSPIMVTNVEVLLCNVWDNSSFIYLFITYYYIYVRKDRRRIITAISSFERLAS